MTLSPNQIISRYESENSHKDLYTSVWNDIFSYYMPQRQGMFEATQGKDRTVKIYDGTPGESLVRLAAMINSTITNQATNWCLLETDDEELNEVQEVKEWLEHDRDQAKKSIENSNFYQEINNFYQDLAGPASACLYVEEYKDGSKDFFFQTQHLKSFVLSIGDQGEFEAVYVLRSMTASQIMRKWQYKKLTGTIPEKARKSMSIDQPGDTFDILHAVYLNDDYDESNIINPLKYKFASVWIALDEKHEIDRGGYHELCYVPEFWNLETGDRYGRGPGWNALADVKGLYSIKKSFLRTGEMGYAPPIFMPDSSQTHSMEWAPYGVVYYNPAAKHAPFPFQASQAHGINEKTLQLEREQVRDHFFITQLHLIDVREMTAEEVRARMIENAKILGPTFGRLNNFLDRLFQRLLGILRRRNKLMPVPDIVQERARTSGVILKPKFSSPIVKAAAMSEVQGITHTAATAFSWAEAGSPDVLDNLDFDKGIRRVADLDGAPPDFLRDEKDVKIIRKQRADAVKQQRELELAQIRAGASKDDAEAQGQYIENQQRRMSGGLSG